MINSVTLKADGSTSKPAATDRITLDAASVVELELGPEEVASFDRVGNDLVLVLKDGRTIVIENFFVTYADGEERSDVVFIDENGVSWWGQYTDGWQNFQIAEIETGLPPAALGFALPGLIPGLLGAGGIILGLDDDSDSNAIPVATADTAAVRESGVVDGGNDDEDGAPEVQGNVLTNDIDEDGDPLVVTGVAAGGTEGEPGVALVGTYGHLTLNPDGSYSYVLDNTLEATQALASGSTAEDVFTYTVSDGNGGIVTSTLTVTVAGTNDMPEIDGVASGEVAEDGTQEVTGQLEVTDPDAGASHVWSVSGSTGSYGELTVDASGQWTYVLDNSNPAVQALAEGETVQDVIRVRVTDEFGAWTEQDVVINVNGANDAPVIDTAASELDARVIEIEDGAEGENTEEHVATGTVAFTDADLNGGGHSASFVPVVDDGSYLGSFTLAPVDQAGDRVEWQFTVDDAVLDSLPEGQEIIQEYTVTVTDADGATVTETVTVTLVGRNDSPETQDDASLVGPGQSAVMDVLANDIDVDSGDTDRWAVTEIDGQPIAPGGSVTLSDGRGTVTLDGAGQLTFVPGPGFTGQLILPYTVDDGSGAGNATSTGNWVINSVAVDITDDASPAGETPDDILASIDDLENVVIDGQAPVGGSITGLTITDGTNTVTVPPESIVINPDGSFSTTADLSDLLDGELTVTLEVEDAAGNTISTTDSIVKDTVAEVEIDPLLIIDGEIPTITGTAEPGSTLTLSIDGTEIEVPVGPDGSWTYTPDEPLEASEVEIAATATDIYGNTNTDTRQVAGLEIEDQQPDAPEDVLVGEDGLPNGSDPTATTETAPATFTIGSSEGNPQQIVIGGTVSGGALSGGTAVTIDQLLAVGTTPIAPIATEYGTITITGFDEATGTVSYSYTLTEDTPDHSNPGGTDAERDIVSETIQIAVIDGDGDTRVSSLEAAVQDDIPEIEVVTGATVSVTASEEDLETDPSASLASLFDVTEGADGATVAYTFELPADGTPSGLTDTVTGEPILLYVEDGVVVGRVGVEEGPVAFTVTVDAATAEVTLDQQRGVSHPTAEDAISIDDTAIRLVATATDGDGDVVSQGTDIGARLSFEDAGPSVEVTPDEGFTLPELTTQDAEATAAAPDTAVADFAGAFTATPDYGADGAATTDSLIWDYALSLAGDATTTPSGLTAGGEAIDLVMNGGLIEGRTAAGELIFTIAVDAATAEVTLTQLAPIDHPDGTDPDEVVQLASDLVRLTGTATVTDGDGDSSATSSTIEIGASLGFTDDGAVPEDDAPVITTEGETAIGYVRGAWTDGAANILDNDAQGADGARVHQIRYIDDSGATQIATIAAGATGTGPIDTQYGSLTVNADGTWTFVPDAEIEHSEGAPVRGDFDYTLIDGDGDVSDWATQGIIIADTGPAAVDDTPQVVEEGGEDLGGNVIDNDTFGADSTVTLYSFTYTDASGTEVTHTFAPGTPSVSVATPTGTLTVGNDGEWSFTPTDSFDHDAPGADQTAGSFSYILVDSDGTQSNEATQSITVTDTDPASTPATVAVDEADVANGGSNGAATDPSDSAGLGITGQDDIADVRFNADTVAALTAQGLTSGGTALSYTVSPDGHTLTATAAGVTIMTLALTNPTDASGTTQGVTVTLSGPLDHADAAGTNELSIPLSYEIEDIDGSTVDGAITVEVTDDIPLTPLADEAVTVVEDGAPVGSANGGENLLANDTLGADGGQVHDITYINRAGVETTAAVTAAGVTVETQYGTLTVASDGSWSYDPLQSVDHVQPANDTELRDDFSYRVIDADGDIAAGSATQQITVTDTVPELGEPEDSSIDEANLPNGTDPDAAGQQVSGSLDLTPGEDTFDTRLNEFTTPLTSDGVPLQYVLSADGHSLTAYQGDGRGAGDRVFVVTLTNPTAPNAGYNFELLQALDHTAESADLEFGVTVTDSDDDTDTASFTVTVTDDVPADAISRTIDEDGSFTVNISADGTVDNTGIWQDGDRVEGTPVGPNMVYELEHGTVTVDPNGRVTYEPAPNYSGEEVFEVRTTDGTGDSVTLVTATVNPVSDAPTLGADADNINTLEDTAVALGLNRPVIVDDATGDGNNAISELLGPVTLSGFPEGAIIQDASGATLFTVGADGQVTIVLSDGPSLTGATGDLTMTAAEYEALQVLPPPHDADNFTVTQSVASYEVDAAGNQLAGVPGATTTDSVTVYVQAVTDDVALTFDGSAASEIGNVVAVVYSAGSTVADVTIAEDTRFNLRDMLEAEFADLDGSELRSVTLTNNTGASIVVNGTTVAVGASIEIAAGGLSGSETAFPSISVGGARNFSGDLNGITVTLNAQDRDWDGYYDGGVVGGTVDGVEEADETNNSVTLNLHVNPVANDVSVGRATTEEDTTVDFLAGVRVTDGGTGSEVIDAISFEIPEGWEMDPAPGSPIWTGSLVGDVYTISFTGGTEAEREAVLDGFAITPPPHSSLDATIVLSVTTTDTQTVDGAVVTNTRTVDHDLRVTVTPVAEEIGDGSVIDTDGDGTVDLVMNPDHNYDAAVAEDTWFPLGTNAGFDLGATWVNQDTSEETYALLTPMLETGDGGQETMDGTQFRWVDEGVTYTETYTGEPIQVPASALSTLEFMPPEHLSGEFSVNVQARTVDYDEDTPGAGTPSTADSGAAVLDGIRSLPDADAVRLAVRAQTRGREDAEIPLVIRPRSSDPSEIFEVEISGIPDGAVITYGGVELTVTDGSVTIDDFSPRTRLTVTPPLNSNENFQLDVTAVAVDTVVIDGVTYTDRSAPLTRTINVAVQGVADAPTVEPLDAVFAEADIDGGTPVMLSDLVTISQFDDDGSETMTLRLTGFPEGFAPIGGTLLTPASVTGEGRVWVIRVSDIDSVEIEVPDNYSGEVTFSVGGVSTENDGDSLTAATVPVTFTVTPSPEATITTNTEVTEDVYSPLGLAIAHQNGDTDETLTGVRISVDQATDATYTLYLPDGAGGYQTLAAAGLTTVTDGGVTYYELTPEQAAELHVLAAPQLDGPLASFDLLYQVSDDSYGTEPAGAETISDWQTATVSLTSLPVTDQPELTISDISGTLASTVVSDANPGDDNAEDTALLGASDIVTVTLNVDSADTDGSERVIRVFIDNVPDGVTVLDGVSTGAGSWMLIYEDVDSLPVNAAGGISVPVEFDVTGGAALLESSPISMTVQVQDRGDEAGAATAMLTDTVQWNLETSFDDGDGTEIPPIIDNWEYTGATATEDTVVRLSDLIDADVSPQSTAPNTFTIRLTNLPDGTAVGGMTRSVIDGQEVWTATVTSEPGDSAAAVQAMLDGLMDSIVIMAPADANDNNMTDPFSFTASIAASVQGGGTVETATETPEVPVDPVTDPATITVAVGPSDPDGELQETDPNIPLSISITNPEDGAAGSLVDGNLYLQIDGDQPGLASGTLEVDGTTYVLTPVTGVPGIPDGDYYVIPGVSMGDTVEAIYTPDEMIAGNVTVDALVRNIETGSTELTSTGSETLPVDISNSGVTVESAPVTGDEASDNSEEAQIELTGLSVTLNDADSEQIDSIMLSNLPNGFLVYVGTSPETAVLASNAGGSGGTNTWILAQSGEGLPDYVAIVPPANWSGTLSGLGLDVTSGELSLGTNLSESFVLPDVTVNPVADGVVALPSSTFGRENTVVPLNLNITLVDRTDASLPGAPDENQETATLQLTGLGEYAAFYVGTELLEDGITYDAASDTYTLTGLTQEQLEDLGLQQASGSLTDADAGTGGTQIAASAWSVDGTDSSDPTELDITVNLTPQRISGGNDSLLWTGSAINGRAGTDTVAIRYGEDVTGDDLSAQLSNIEVLDLGIAGTNTIDELSPEDLLAITDAGNALTIEGSADDVVNLSDDDWMDNGDGTYTGYIPGGPGVVTEVTLSVAGGVQITPPDSGFVTTPPGGDDPGAPFPGVAPTSFMGLGQLDDMGDEDEDAPQDDAAGALTFEDLMDDGSSEDLADLLPEETGSPAALPEADAFASVDPSMNRAWDEELQENPLSEH